MMSNESHTKFNLLKAFAIYLVKYLVLSSHVFLECSLMCTLVIRNSKLYTL